MEWREKAGVDLLNIYIFFLTKKLLSDYENSRAEGLFYEGEEVMECFAYEGLRRHGAVLCAA